MFYQHFAIILLLIMALSLKAEVTLDGSLGRGGPLPGPDYFIGADLGQQHSGNLFHSFHDFNLQSHESATFSGPNSVQNVISRVTGGNPSNLNGLIRSTIPNADMYFLNPYGVIFGPNARLDVQGSFHASTADYLRLGNGGRFEARLPNNSLLTVAPVEAFGFLTDSPAAITLQDSKLSVPDGNTLSLIGGNLQIQNTTLRHFSDDDVPMLSAKSGRINLASVAAHNEVIPTATGLNLSASGQSGSIITENALIDTSGEGGGSLFIRARRFELINSQIDSMTLGNQDGGLLDIQVDNLHLSEGSELFTRTYGTGKGTALQIQATDTVQLSGLNHKKRSSTINTDTMSQSYDAGDASEVLIEARNVSFRDGAHIWSSSQGGGQGSQITIRAQESVLFTGNDESGWRIAGLTMDTSGAGDGASLLLEAKNVTFDGGSGVQGGMMGKGNLGDITIRATERLTLKGLHSNGAGSRIFKRVMGPSTGGHGGELLVEAGELVMEDGAVISANTNGPGEGGNITLRIEGTLLLAGVNEEGKVSRISSSSSGGDEAESVGKGGTIIVEAGRLVVTEGTQIKSVSSVGKGRLAGNAGEIHLRVTGEVLLDGVNLYGENSEGFGSGIYASSLGLGEAGNAGKIVLEANTLTIKDGAVIKSSTNNKAQGGNIEIRVKDTLTITGDASHIPLQEPLETQVEFLQEFSPTTYNQSTSGIYATSDSSDAQAGRGGNITVSAQNLILTDKGLISTGSSGGGQAGHIIIDVARLQLDGSASIASESHLPNTYQVASVSERDAGILILGDVVEVADVENGKQGRYVNTGQELLRITPVYTVPNIAALSELSDQYSLTKGDVVIVKDAGAGESARFIYDAKSTFDAKVWVKINEDVTVTLDNLDELVKIKDEIAPEEVPYSSGTLIKVEEGLDGKPMFFVYSASIVNPFSGHIKATPLRLNAFNVADSTALNQLTDNLVIQDGDVASVGNARFVFKNHQWIPFSGNALTVANIIEQQALIMAQAGNIAKVANTGDDFIYTGSHWIPLNTTVEVANLAERDRLPATTGTLVKVTDAGGGKPESFFYEAGQWVKQVKGGEAGTITIHAGETFQLSNDSTISTAAISAGGGGIIINADNLLYLIDSQITTSVQEGAGKGGDLTIQNPVFVIMDNGRIVAQAHAGRGGNIRLTSDNLIKSNDSLVSASSRLGIDGNVAIDSPEINLDDFLVVLPGGYIDNAKLPKPCNIQDVNELSTFRVKTVRDGMPMTPKNFME
jgi:filamentous hemagglutinin family protein